MNISQTQHMRTSSLAVLWLVWLAATSVGMIVGGLVAFPLGWSIGETAEQALGQVPALLVVGLVMGGVLFGLVAAAQAVVLRGRVPAAGRWILVSAVAGAVGIAVILAALNDNERAWSNTLLPMTAFTLLGVWLGAAQWLVLRRHVARAAWWVLVSAASLGLTLAVLFGISAEGRELVSLLLSGVIYGAITGAGMAWLLRDANKVNG